MRVVAITADTSLTVTLAMMDDWEVVSAHDVDQAAEAAPFAAVGLVGVGQTEEGLDIVERLHTRGVGIPFVVVGDRPAPFGSRALVLTRPFSLDDLRHAVDQAIATEVARSAPAADGAGATGAEPDAASVEVTETVETIEAVEESLVVTLEEPEPPAPEPSALETEPAGDDEVAQDDASAEVSDLDAPFAPVNGSERVSSADLPSLEELQADLAPFEVSEPPVPAHEEEAPAEPQTSNEATAELDVVSDAPGAEDLAPPPPDELPPPLDDLPPPPLDELVSVSLHGPAGERDDDSPPPPPLDDEPDVLPPEHDVLDEAPTSEPTAEAAAEAAAEVEEPRVVEEPQAPSERSDDDRVLRRNAPAKAASAGIEATLIERLRGAYAAVAELEALVEELPVLGDPTSLATGFLDEIARVFSPDTAIVAERVRDTYRVVAARGLSAVEREMPMRADQVLLADADRSGQALLVHPVALSSDLVEGINGVCTEGLMCAPIAVDGRTVGIAIVGKDRIEEFELSKLAGLAREAAPFVAIAQLLWRLRHPA